MKTRKEIKVDAAKYQKALDDALSPGRVLHVNWSKDEDKPAMSAAFGVSRQVRKPLPKQPSVNAIVVGIDIREWTRRAWAAQVIVASVFNSCARQTVSLLRSAGVLERQDDPLLMLPTGDGAFVIFSDGEGTDEKKQKRLSKSVVSRAFSFVFTLNTLLTEKNRSGTIDEVEENPAVMHILPIYPRFCLTHGELRLCIDVTDNLNALGPAMVTCARILATDHGNHLLVQDQLLHECDRLGGLERILSRGRGGDWHASVRADELPERRVKSGTFRYADVVADYSDAAILRYLGSPSVPPQTQHIGSHDSSQLRE